MASKFSVDGMAAAIMESLNEYAEVKAEDLKTACKETAKEAAKKLKSSSPPKGKPGKYSKGWGTKVEYENADKIQVAVKNKVYQLTHLLEFGHAKRNGGRVDPVVHIAPVEEWAAKEVERRIKNDN